MRLFIAASLVFVVFSATSFTQGNGHSNTLYPDISILQSDARGITLEYRLTDLRYDTLSLDNREYTDILFFGAQSPDRIFPDLPDLKYRAVTIALPSAGRPSIKAIQTDYRSVRGVRIPPLGDIQKDEDGELFRTTQGIDIRTDVDQDLVDIYDIGEVRGVVLGTLRLHPIQFSRDGSTIQIHTRIVVRVSFDSGSFGAIDEYTYNSFRNTVINIDQVSVVPESLLRMDGLRAEPVSHQNSVLSDGPWYRITVESDGMYRIDASTLQEAGIPINTIDPSTLKMYGNGGRMLPEDITEHRPEDLVEIAIYVHDEANGSFDSGDYIVFYGIGTTLWDYDFDSRLYKHQYNYYTGKNTYFLTYGGESGKRMQDAPSVSEPDSDPISPQYFMSRIVHRDPKINLLGSGKEWMGESFSPGSVTVFTNMLHGYTHTVNVPIQYRVQVAARAPNQTRFRFQDEGVDLGTINIPGVSLITEVGNYAARGPTTIMTRTGPLTENRSTLRFEYEAGAQSEGFLEWFEIHYPRRFEPLDDYLQFSSPDTTGVVRYNVQGFTSSSIIAYDVTDHASIMRITNATIGGGSIQFQRQQQSGQPSRYTAVAPNGYRIVNGIEPVDNSNIRGIADGSDFIIITHPEFLDEAERLKQHRESFTPNKLSTTVVNVKHVYNEYSGGLEDPSAIRDFLYHAYGSWQTKPRYVLLFGAGSFDYRRHLGQRENFIPTHQGEDKSLVSPAYASLNQINTYTSDDFFVQFSPGSRRPSLAIGRLNAINQSDARILVDKIIQYETNSEFGPWRNLITYLADDGLTRRGEDDGPIHTLQTEDLAQNFTPDAFEKNKIYMIQYPAENTALGRRMPEVNKAIVNSFNRGTLIMNWTGHGNPAVWAYEWIFRKETTIPQLNNRDRLTFITAATCDFSRFDDPREQSGAELLVSREQGGAIAVVSASRIVWASDNAQFNNIYYSNLLNPDSNGEYPRIGNALFSAKQIRSGVNEIKYLILGDPTVRLHIPSYDASVRSINGETVNETVNLKALQKVTIEGMIRQADGTPLDDFNGRMFVVVYDSDKKVRISKPRWVNHTFIMSGYVIFRGESSVTQGSYSSTFVVPKDISHEGGAGRIALYFWENGSDGRGFSRDIVLGGIDTTVTPDTEGPDIAMYLDDRGFRSGDLVSERPLLLVDLFDDSGINISGGGVGHRIEAWLNEGEGIDLTDYYTGAVDSYQEGSIEYQFEELDPGPHHLRMRAWDVHNNSSTNEIFFQVATTDKLSVQNVYNYPNPFQRETVFTFQHNQSVPIDVEIKVYTVAGRLIAQLKEFSVTDRFVRVPWNGLDDDGDRIANGVYFYKVIARTVDGEYTSEVLGRMVVMR